MKIFIPSLVASLAAEIVRAALGSDTHAVDTLTEDRVAPVAVDASQATLSQRITWFADSAVATAGAGQLITDTGASVTAQPCLAEGATATPALAEAIAAVSCQGIADYAGCTAHSAELE